MTWAIYHFKTSEITFSQNSSKVRALLGKVRELMCGHTENWTREMFSFNFSPRDCQKFPFTALQKHQPPDWQGTTSLLRAFTQPSFIFTASLHKEQKLLISTQTGVPREFSDLPRAMLSVRTAAKLALEARPQSCLRYAGLI